jgi:3-methyl-2-oxobutanoate hydroxymethyltransferase
LSTAVITKRKSVTDIAAMRGKDKIVSLTAYTAPIARLLDPHVDLLLVGDSLGMVVYGFDSTLPVTLDMMIAHGAAVVRSSERALVVVDMPFGSYQESPAQAFRSRSASSRKRAPRRSSWRAARRWRKPYVSSSTAACPCSAMSA